MNLIGIGSESLSIINNPFAKSKITRVQVVYRKNLFEDEWLAEGRVEFKNGQTSGDQKFEGKDFNDVLVQVREFLNNLK